MLVQGTATLPSWVTAHYEETDTLNRRRDKGFKDLPFENKAEWHSAIGIETNSVLVCVNGIARVINAVEDGTASTSTHVYKNGADVTTRTYRVGDSVSLDELE